MEKDKAYYLYRIDLTKKVRNQLRVENELLEDQVDSQKMLFDEVNDEILHVQDEIKQINKMILHETMALDDVKSVYARLEYINSNKKDQIDDLREELGLRITEKRKRENSIALLEELKKERFKLASYYKNELKGKPKVKSKSKAMKKLDDITEIINSRKNEIKGELDALKKKLDL